MTSKQCKDCGSTTRALNNPGPRCTTCWRAELKARDERDFDLRLQKLYGIDANTYWDIYEFQNGKCYICQRATGKTKRLSVDHSHETGEVRGLLCSLDNRMLGHARDNSEFFDRAAEYLRNPPYQRMKEQSNDA